MQNARVGTSVHCLLGMFQHVRVVYVEAPDKSSGKRKQKVHIEYDLVGYIPVDELIKAEQARPKSYLFQGLCILLFYDHRACVRYFSVADAE